MILKKTKPKYKKSIFSFIDMLATKKMLKLRPINIEKTKLEPIETNYHIEKLIQQLHPKKQILKVCNINNISPTVKLIQLAPYNNKKISLFRPGQFINITFNINTIKINRPFSIVSSLKDAYENNYYEIAVKKKENGYVSNYVHNQLKVGDLLETNAPDGEFYYSKIRDSKNIIALVGGIGITPIYSLVKWINDYQLDVNITILYSNKAEEEMVFSQAIENIAIENQRIKIQNFITKQISNKYINRRIEFQDIQKINNYTEASFFICGPNNFVTFWKEELLKQKILLKFIRTETSNVLNLTAYENEYQNLGQKEIYQIKVHTKNQTYNISAFANETIFSAIQRANLPINSSCLIGKCSLCRVRLINGNVFTPKNTACYRKSDNINKIIYTCSTYPITDLEIDML